MSGTTWRPWASLRGRFLLVIVLGMALPIALLGPWLTRSARDSGEALLRTRLEESLADAANSVGSRWIGYRSSLLHMAEDPAMIAALRDRRMLDVQRDSSLATAFAEGWRALDGVADAVIVRDTGGVVRASLDRAHGGGPGAAARASVTLPVQLPIFAALSGERVGSLEAQLRLGALLPANVALSGVGGSVLAIFDRNGSASLLPLSMSSDLFESDRFEWAGEEWIVARRQVREPSMRFALAAPLAPITEPFSQAARRAAFALTGVLAVGLLVSMLMTRRITGPLERLAVAADDVAAGRFERRVDETGPDELRRLGGAFNTMAQSLRSTLQQLSQREAVAAVGEFAASLAHEVRNPLTAIRLDLERARERVGDPARADELLLRALGEIDRLERTVTGSLRIARSGSLALTGIDLRQPLDAAMSASEPSFASRCARLDRWPLPATPLIVRGNSGALEQLFLNLLLNAAEALPEGGCARVRVDESATDVRVCVSDDGLGMPAEVLSRVREPFYTTKERGTGLGLSIGERIARAHGASLVVESAPGAGTAVSVTLSREPD
jgi:signal transduction histidine kinase